MAVSPGVRVVEQFMRLQPRGFWSYARQDNLLSEGLLSKLRLQVLSAAQKRFGKQTITIFEDTGAIPPGSEWEKEIVDAIGSASFFIPIVTPAFVESEMCCWEVERFLEREVRIKTAFPELASHHRIFPILYTDPQFSRPHNIEVSELLKSLQYCDFSMLDVEGDQSRAFRTGLGRLAVQIASLLAIDRPASEQAERRYEEAARARAETERTESELQAAERARAVALRQAEEAEHRREVEQERIREAQRLALAREQAQLEAEQQRAAKQVKERAQEAQRKELDRAAAAERAHRLERAAQARKEKLAKLSRSMRLSAPWPLAAIVVAGILLLLKPGSSLPTQPPPVPEMLPPSAPVQVKMKVKQPTTILLQELAGTWVRVGKLSYCRDGRHAERIEVAGGGLRISDVGLPRDFTPVGPDKDGWWLFDGAKWRRDGNHLVQFSNVEVGYERCP